MFGRFAEPVDLATLARTETVARMLSLSWDHAAVVECLLRGDCITPRGIDRKRLSYLTGLDADTLDGMLLDLRVAAAA